MNDDTISRREAIDAIEELKNRYFDRKVILAKAQDAVNNLPTAEKVGTWIRHPEVKNIYGGVYIECSECREKYVVRYVEDEKFCRNCGARMKGEEDE